MKQLHVREKQELERILANNGHPERSQDVIQVLDAFLAEEGHQDPADIQRRLKARGLRFDFEFIQDALELFCHYGFAQAKEFKGRGKLYEHRHLGQHHDHLICTKCGKVEEFVNPIIEELQVSAARGKGFVPLEHRLDVYGLCGECARRPGEAIYLSEAEQGECFLVCGHEGGEELQRRLTDMGLNPGAEVEVLSASGGPLVVACRGSRLALGRGLSEKVKVEPAPKEKPRRWFKRFAKGRRRRCDR